MFKDGFANMSAGGRIFVNRHPTHAAILANSSRPLLAWAPKCRARHRQENTIECANLPPRFDGFTILHISDTHVDMNERAMRRLVELLPGLNYDLCVLTGDYRGQTFGTFDATLQGMVRIIADLKQPILGVLGNHDTIQMLLGLEAMGIRMLQNECETIRRGDQLIFVAGIDDAH